MLGPEQDSVQAFCCMTLNFVFFEFNFSCQGISAGSNTKCFLKVPMLRNFHECEKFIYFVNIMVSLWLDIFSTQVCFAGGITFLLYS